MRPSDLATTERERGSTEPNRANVGSTEASDRASSEGILSAPARTCGPNVRPKLIIFASGSKDAGGSGFENLVNATKAGALDADIVAVVSNHEHGGVRKRAERLGILFVLFGKDSDYAKIVADTGAEWVALSGWLKHAHGLDPAKAINIHPALLSYANGKFGGKGMYGKYIHEAVKVALDAGEITESGFTMHFVTEEHDRGPAFFEYRVPLTKGMSVDEIASAVQKAEHEWQPKITNMVVHGEICWDGEDPKSLIVPSSYQHLPKPKMWC